MYEVNWNVYLNINFVHLIHRTNLVGLKLLFARRPAFSSFFKKKLIDLLKLNLYKHRITMKSNYIVIN